MVAHCSWWRCCCRCCCCFFLLLVVDGWPCDACVKIIVQFIYGSLHLIRSISCVPFCHFFPVLTVCCTTLFSLFTYTCSGLRNEWRRKKNTTTPLTLNRSTPTKPTTATTKCNAFVLEASVSVLSHSLYGYVILLLCTAAEHKFLQIFFLLGFTHISFIYYLYYFFVAFHIIRCVSSWGPK